jgi:hypothetical protein
LTLSSGKLNVQGVTLTIGSSTTDGTISGSSTSYIVAYDAGSTIISSISMTNSVSGQSATSSEKLILAGGTGSVVFTGTSPSSSDYYRAIYVAGHIPGRNGMIQTKYKWLHGQYPNYWVKNIYTNVMSDNASQELYIRTKSAANACKMTQQKEFIGNQNIPLESEYALRLTQRCADPLPYQQHIPVPMMGTCVGSGTCV